MILVQILCNTKSSAHAGLFVIVGATIGRPITILRTCNARPYGKGGSICKNSAALFTFYRFYGIIQLIDKLEFDEGVNDENIIHDWRHYGSWKNNCVPTVKTRFTE